MTIFDDFMSRGARLRGVTVRDQADIWLTRQVVRELGDELRGAARIAE